MRPVVARCHRCISADRGGTIAPPPRRPRGEAGEREVRSDGHPRRARPSLRRKAGGEGGLAWGSCGRSGRHALGRAAGASCVQRLDDSRNSAIHTTYRISLRSSSLQEPRYPLLRVVAFCVSILPRGGISDGRKFLKFLVPPRVWGAKGLSKRRRARTGTTEGGRPERGREVEGVPPSSSTRTVVGRPQSVASLTIARLRQGERRHRPRLRARSLGDIP